jgi:hypothetical protein
MNFGELIPIVAMLIPLTVLTGIFIVTPIAKALSKRPAQSVGGADTEALARRLATTEERLEVLERSIRHLEEAQDFNKQLRAPQSGSMQERVQG